MIFDPPPNFRLPSFGRYIVDVRDAIDEMAPRSRSKTRYVSAAGNDASDGLTENTPWQTLARVQTYIDTGVAAADTAYLLRCGDAWSDALLDVSRSATFASYGRGAPPVITRYTRSYSPAGDPWTDDGTAYYRTEASAVVDVMEVGAEWDPYFAVASVAQCKATARSWYWDDATDRVYINPGAGRDPNASGDAISYVGSLNQTDHLIDILPGAGNVRFEGIHVYGGGLTSTPGATLYAIRSQLEDDGALVVKGSLFCRGGYHLIGGVGAGGTGGILLAQGNTVGLCRGTGGGTSPFVSYVTGGDNVGFAWDNICKRGNLPVGTTFVSDGRPMQAHTGGGAAKLGLVVEYGMQQPTHAMQYANAGTFQDRPAPSSRDAFDEYRCFVVNRKVGTSWDDPLPITGGAVTTNESGVAFINCEFYVQGIAAGSERLGDGDERGWAINCRYVIDHSAGVFLALFHGRPTFLFAPGYEHCDVIFLNTAPAIYGTPSYSAGPSGVAATDAVMRYCLIGGGSDARGQNGQHVYPGIHNNVDDSGVPLPDNTQLGNATNANGNGAGYFGGTILRDTNDPLAVRGGITIDVDDLGAFPVLIDGATSGVGYDRMWNLRDPSVVYAGSRIPLSMKRQKVLALASG